ncbi:MAG: glycerol kinase GlpK [Desulfovibrio sp.]|uniref:glycerol kinase GlpK n=1 Tax=Desulfovibrio sp. TaxID=885 RepID=UPI002A35ACF2|nr:glycerol kinase GlpK [Desulfovibrio sp.]MDY0258524.1 glycerol kinase GlpK [Desulfovibrio sp.]
MAAQYILALDQGTTSSRAILFDHNANIVQIAQKEFTQLYLQAGWVEHSPNEIFDSQSYVVRECLRNAQVSGNALAAIGITNQRETTIVWEKSTGAPIYNAIVWQDRRTAAFCDQLRAEGKARVIQDKTGLVLDAYFSGSKIRWILDTIPGARARAEAGELLFGTVDTWLVWNLSKRGAHVTDPSNASRTLLFNIHTRQWDDELLAIMGVPRAMLPEIVPSSSITAWTHPEFFGHAVPIAGIAGDQQAAAYGNGCMKEGMAKNTYGTGCFLLLNTGERPPTSQNNLLATVAWQTDRGCSYALEGSVFVAGAAVQWLRDGLGLIKDSSELEGLATTVPDNGGVYMVPAFVGMGAPYWDQYARGTIVGLTRGTTRGHIARAAIEAIALQTLDIIDAMKKDTGISLTTLRVDGGASRNNMLMQFQADLTGVVVERPTITETTALGAAYLAGLAVEFWESEEALAHKWKLDRRFTPTMAQDKKEKMLHQWHRAVARASHWIEEQTPDQAP